MEVRNYTTRRLKYSSNYIALTLIVLGILTVLNFFFIRHFTRIDLTQDKRYTLTSSTKEMLGNLDDIVNIKLYLSKKLPPYLVNLKREVTDILDEYKAYSGGNLPIKLIDPTENPKLQQELRFMGIPQVQLNIIEKDQAQLTNVYFGMAIFYADKKEVIPFINETRTLEYDLTSAIIKVTSSETKTIGIFTGKDHALSEDYQETKQILEKQYKVEEVELKEGEESLGKSDTLIISGSRELKDTQKYEIDQFLMQGGKIVFLIDTVEIKEGLQASSVKPGIDDLLEHHGVKVEENLVLDRSNAPAAFRSGFMTFQLPYPFWVKVMSKGFSPDNPAVSNLESLVLPWTSTVKVLEGKVAGITITELAKSTPFSWTRKGFYMLNPQQKFYSPEIKTESHLLALAASGKFKSFYIDKPIPTAEESKDKKEAEAKRETIKESPETQIIVIGNSRFINNEFLSRFRDNRVFFLNIIDWLTLGEQLIGIRSRGATDRPLKETTEYMKTLIKSFNMFGVPILLILFGLLRFYLRRRKKRAEALAW
jgi:gliding-associated putative ABC transporter substrate-binding component GldG